MVNSQSISRKVISTAGGTLSGSGNMLTYNIGEPAVYTLNVGGNMLTQGFEQPGEQLITGAVSTSLCVGSIISVPYNSIDVGGGNIFTAQLSNSAGSFANPVTIGTALGNASGSMSCAVPLSTPSGSGYRVRVVSSSPAVIAGDNGTNIVIGSLPVPVISGNNAFCAGGFTTINAGAWSGYLWSTGATTQTVSANIAGTYIVTVTNSFGCTGTVSKTVTMVAAPAPSISGVTTICSPGSTVLTANAGFSSYSWSTGSTLQSITVSSPGTYTVSVANSSGCTASTTKTVVAGNAAPQQPGVISGPAVVCKNSNAPYSIALVPGATSYTWTATSGATVSSGQGTANVVINFSNTATNATLTVVASNSCGTSTQRTFTYVISNLLPATPFAITGSLFGLCNQSSAPYSCPLVANAISYLWTVPAGVTILTGQGTNSITVKYNSAFTTTGNISVVAQNGCGSSAARTVTVNAKPKTPVITGLNWACKNQTGLVYSVAPVAGATSYTWTIVSGSTLVSGQGTSSIVVNWGSINGLIYCKANSACGSSPNGTFAVAFTCKEATSSFDISEFTLFPNPADEITTLQFDGFAEGNATIAIYDVLGKQIMATNFSVITGVNQFPIKLDNFAKGIYTVKVTFNGYSRMEKLVVQ
nr:T9SS type A sorting domain-containing protein [Bacteroidota bacterium]